jgi:hypothetical protein
MRKLHDPSQRRSRVRRTPGAIEQREQGLQRAYIEAVARNGTLTGACKAARISVHTVYAWRERDETFVIREHEAREAFADTLEREMVRRGVHGVQQPVFQRGRLVGYVVEYSDQLLIKLIRAARPEKYRERFSVDSAERIIVRVLSARVDPHALV